MNAIVWRLLLGALVATSCATSTSAQSAPELIRVRVKHWPDLGTNGFAIQVSGESNRSIDVTAPDGTVFQTFPPTSISSLTLAEITSRFTGDWIIEDDWDLPIGAPAEQHRFTAGSASLSTFMGSPKIVLPANGSIVPEKFIVHGSGTGGISVTGQNLIYENGIGRVDLAGLNLPLPIVVEGRLRTTWINSQTSVSPLQPNSSHQFFVDVGTTKFSAPFTWTVVPEPSTLALGSFAFLSLAALRRRK